MWDYMFISLVLSNEKNEVQRESERQLNHSQVELNVFVAQNFVEVTIWGLEYFIKVSEFYLIKLSLQ
jgi:hypothetical protein